jgi:hypothetical protein
VAVAVVVVTKERADENAVEGRLQASMGVVWREPLSFLDRLLLVHRAPCCEPCLWLLIIREFKTLISISVPLRKPKNARSKRALEAREPKEVEDARTCLFIKGTKTGEVLNGVLKDLASPVLSCRTYGLLTGYLQTALKRPYAISFNKKNELRPFEESDNLAFLSQKNDASSLLFAQTTKKRPNSLTLARTFDGRVLDLLELGVENFVPMSEFKVRNLGPRASVSE